MASWRHERTETLATLEAISIPDRPDDVAYVLRQATLTNGIAHARTELVWLDELDAQLDRLNR